MVGRQGADIDDSAKSLLAYHGHQQWREMFHVTHIPRLDLINTNNGGC